jgi:hypothetical protein
MQHVEAISGASRAARECTGTFAAHGAGEERRGRRRHPGRGRRNPCDVLGIDIHRYWVLCRFIYVAELL